MKALHDMEPGDAIFHSRYCFHKGEQFDEGETKTRYSIRYMPADARLFDNEYEAALREKGLTDGAPLAHAGGVLPPGLAETDPGRAVARAARAAQEGRIYKAAAGPIVLADTSGLPPSA